MLQPGRYFADVCRHLGLEELIEDPRFSTAEDLMANASQAGASIAEAIGAQPYAHWVEKLQTMEGPWAPVQSPLEISNDPQMAANGYICPSSTAKATNADSWPIRSNSTSSRRF